MTGCENREAMLNSLLDGELDAVNSAAAEEHLASCHECRAEMERLRAVREALAHPGVRHSAPASLREAVEAALPPTSSSAARHALLPSWLLPGVTGAVAASLAILLLVQPFATSNLDDELIAGHVRSLQAAHLTDVRTSDEHRVRPWFNGKIDFAPPVPELAGEGFPLVGGRLDYVDGRTVAALVYRRRLHTINLFVWPAPPAGERRVQKDGYSVDEWSAGGLRFSAVSDIAPADLEAFRKAFTGGR
jgi:anti-sigma factor RsiW